MNSQLLARPSPAAPRTYTPIFFISTTANSFLYILISTAPSFLMLRYILMQQRLWTWYNIHDLCFVSQLHYCCIDVLHEDFISSSYPRLLLWTHGSLPLFSSSSLFLYIYLLHILLEQSPGGTVFFRLLLSSSLSRLAGVWIACSVHELQTALGQFSYIDLSCCCKKPTTGHRSSRSWMV